METWLVPILTLIPPILHEVADIIRASKGMERKKKEEDGE